MSGLVPGEVRRRKLDRGYGVRDAAWTSLGAASVDFGRVTDFAQSETNDLRPERSDNLGEARWPMALAVLAVGFLHAVLPAELRTLPPELGGDSRWVYGLVVLVLLGALIIGDPGRIDRQKTWLRVLTISLIALISADNAIEAVRLLVSISSARPFTEDANKLLVAGGAIWLSNVIAFGLWYWALDRGGPAARAHQNPAFSPAFVFPEMLNSQYVTVDWYPKFVDYLHTSFTTATAFSPTDVSAIKPWAKLTMMLEESISLIVAILVIARAVNIMK